METEATALTEEKLQEVIPEHISYQYQCSNCGTYYYSFLDAVYCCNIEK